jgi:hypothetical protein
MRTGGWRCSTHCSRAFNMSNDDVPSPPEQCVMPGTMKSRIRSAALRARRAPTRRSSGRLMLFAGEIS